MGVVGAGHLQNLDALAGHRQKLDYEEFSSQWALEQQVTIRELQGALDAGLEEEELQQVVQKATALYESYYDVMDTTVKQDVLQVVTPSWKTPLEKAFMWLGEWRPSVAYQLVYALAGQKVVEELAELLQGIETPSFASLSASQLAEISDMQMRTLEVEDQLRYHLTALQRSVADRPMLSLAQVAEKNEFTGRRGDFKEGKAEGQPGRKRAPCKGGAGEGIGRDGMEEDEHMLTGEGEGRNGAEGLFKVAVSEKLKRLEELSLSADSLRRRTLTGLLEVFNTVQRAQFLLACCQLQVAIRHVGEKFRHMSQV